MGMTSFLFAKKYIGGFGMIELSNVKDMDRVKHLPLEVQNGILDALQVLDEDYGEDRDYKKDGGFVAIIESLGDFRMFMKFNLDFAKDEVITEYRDVLANDTFTMSLLLIGDNYQIVAVTPKELSDFENVRKLLNSIWVFGVSACFEKSYILKIIE